MIVKMKKAVALLTCVTVMCGLTACGGKKKDEGKVSNTTMLAETDAKDVTFAMGDEAITGYSGDIAGISVVGDKIYFSTNDWLEGEPVLLDEGVLSSSSSDAYADDQSVATDGNASEEVSEEGEYDISYDVITRVYSAPLSGGKAEEILSATDLSDDNIEYSVDKIFADKDGNVYLMLSGWGKDTDYENVQSKTIKVKSDGTYEDYDTSFLMQGKNPDDFWISNILFDDAGNMIVLYQDELKVFKDGKEKGSFKPEGEYPATEGMTLSRDGKVLVAYQAESDSGSYLKISEFDTESCKIGDTYSAAASYFSNQNSLMTGSGDYDFYYEINAGIIGYNISEKKTVKVFDFIASGIDSDLISFKYMVSPEKFIAVTYDESDYTQKIMFFNKVDPSSIEDKTTLTLATLWSDDSTKQSVINFNKENSKYRIVIKDYSEEDDPMAKMSADIAAGSIPDIYIVDNGIGNLSIQQCVAKGMFEDLTPYFEKDPDVNTNDILPNVLEALKVDGKIYFTADNFTAFTMMCKKMDPEIDGWNFAEFREFVESKGDDVKAFEDNTQNGLLDAFLYNVIDDYIDWSAGKAYFDGEEFKNLLEFCGKGEPGELNWEDYDETEFMSSLKNGKLLFMSVMLTPQDLQMYKAVFGGEVSLPGFPCADRNGKAISLQNCMAISSKCADKEGAWEFVKQQMTREYQGKNYVWAWGMPTRSDIFDLYMKVYTTSEEYVDEFGNEIYPRMGSMGFNDLEIESHPLTAEEEEIFRHYIETANEAKWYDDNIAEIVREEAQSYFKGDKSLDEVCTIINGRVTTYINENK